MFLFQKVLSFSLLLFKVIFSSPQSHTPLLLISSPLVTKGSPPLHAWQLTSMGHLRALYKDHPYVTHTTSCVWWFFLDFSNISGQLCPPPQTSTSYSITCTSCWWLWAPRVENTATIERNCGPWSDPGTSQCVSNVLSLLCS